MSPDPLPAPAELMTALDTAGFHRVGEGRPYVRYGWPGQRTRGSLVVLRDSDAPEYPTMVAALLAELDDAERCGQAAGMVLDLVDGQRSKEATGGTATG